MNIGEAEITTDMAVGEVGGVQPHPVEQRGVQIVDGHAALDGVVAELGRAAIAKTCVKKDVSVGIVIPFPLHDQLRAW